MRKQRLDNQRDGLLLLSTFTLRTIDVIKQIYDFREIWLRIWNQWKTFIYKKNGNLRIGMSINFNFQNGNKLQRVWKKKKKKTKKDLYDMQSKHKFSSKLLFVYINKQLKYYYRDAINSWKVGRKMGLWHPINSSNSVSTRLRDSKIRRYI